MIDLEAGSQGGIYKGGRGGHGGVGEGGGNFFNSQPRFLGLNIFLHASSY